MIAFFAFQAIIGLEQCYIASKTLGLLSSNIGLRCLLFAFLQLPSNYCSQVVNRALNRLLGSAKSRIAFETNYWVQSSHESLFACLIRSMSRIAGGGGIRLRARARLGLHAASAFTCSIRSMSRIAGGGRG